MNSTISVIIPVYNVEQYLCECLDSVLSQSYTALQVILIDDGSTDSSGMICDNYSAKDSRVVVIHQKNGGAATARNAGLRVATGRYISFVDGDDYLESEAYVHMVTKLEASNADVIQCSFRDVFQNKFVPRLIVGQQTEFSCIQYLEQFTKDWTCGLLWDKLFVRSVFEGILFEEGHKIDDEYFTYQGIMNAHKIIRDPIIIYNYRKRKSSIMQSFSSREQIVNDRIDYLNKRRVNIINRYPELRESFDAHFVEMMVVIARDPMATKESKLLIKQQLRAYCTEDNHTAIDIRLWPALIQLSVGLLKVDSARNIENSSSELYFN